MRIAIAVLLLAGCGGWDAEPRARTVAGEILECPEIALEPRGDSVWHASGCGREIDVACTTAVNEPRCIRVRLRGSGETGTGSGSGSGAGTETETGTSAGASSADAVPGAVPDPDPDPDPVRIERAAHERALRDAIELRREDVLACAGRDRVVVRVRTDAHGASSVTLGGELAGTPEEGCVRAALSDLVGAPSIEVVHLLRR